MELWFPEIVFPARSFEHLSSPRMHRGPTRTQLLSRKGKGNKSAVAIYCILTTRTRNDIAATYVHWLICRGRRASSVFCTNQSDGAYGICSRENMADGGGRLSLRPAHVSFRLLNQQPLTRGLGGANKFSETNIPTTFERITNSNTRSRMWRNFFFTKIENTSPPGVVPAGFRRGYVRESYFLLCPTSLCYYPAADGPPTKVLSPAADKTAYPPILPLLFSQLPRFPALHWSKNRLRLTYSYARCSLPYP